jgi:hypothetical protein
MAKYIISTTVQIRPTSEKGYVDWQNGLKIEYGATIEFNGTVAGAAAIAARYEQVATEVALEHGGTVQVSGPQQ